MLFGKVNINVISPNWLECEKVVRISYTVLLVTIQRPYVMIFYDGCTHRTVFWLRNDTIRGSMM